MTSHGVPPIRHVVFDVDDVLVDTDEACAKAERAIAEPLAARLPRPAAEAAARGLSAAYRTLIGDLRSGAGEKNPAAALLDARIARLQAEVVREGHEVKRWSRDTLIALALEDAGVPWTGELVTAAADHYWRVVRDESALFEDARRAIEDCRRRGLTVHLATNSDGFLGFDSARGAFSYHPERARARKLERLTLLAGLGLGARDVSIGDPIGKPKRAFFEKVLRELGEKRAEVIDVRQVLPVGDSLTNDVLPLVEMGAPRGVWLVRKAAGERPAVVPEHPRVTRVGSLDDLAGLL